ncbi:MAG: HAD family phosphatase [Bacteroidales bacterium]|nr:HAD family hydrolase [Lentimicrobiaceae bacterium]MDG1136058.1 HAD family phosphatase [Bacteroidales bacterium]MDG1902002.1 HAD family phosphatase [Bacteroidales bacterium]MDG2080381.1 HAD family phosphatase [Bacteroidales bacterium]
MNVKNIIFDFGGVILDIDPERTMNEFVTLGFSSFEKLMSPVFVESIIAKFEKGILTPELFRQKLRSFMGIEVTDQEIDYAWNALLYDIPKERIEIIEKVKENYNIYLLSNSNEIHYDLFVRDLQLRFGYREFDELFHKAYFSFDLHLLKPNPEIYEFVINQHGMIPEETLFIDDKPENIDAAKKLGLLTYTIAEPERIRDIFNDGLLVEGTNIS